MSINKTPGQTLKVAELQLQAPCFTYGQLYVGTSHMGAKANPMHPKIKYKTWLIKKYSLLMQHEYFYNLISLYNIKKMTRLPTLINCII